MRIQKVVCFASALVLAAALGEAQSLAAVAKKEKARQAKVRETGQTAKVYTDEVRPAPAPGEGSARVSMPRSADEEGGVQEGEDEGATGGPRVMVVPTARPQGSPVPERDRRDRRSLRDVTVTLYVTSWCPYCRAARAFLASQPNVRLVEHDVEKDKARSAEMLSKTGGERGVPVIDVEGRVMQGFSPGSVTAAIADARKQARR